jgi:hypothetical protein
MGFLGGIIVCSLYIKPLRVVLEKKNIVPGQGDQKIGIKIHPFLKRVAKTVPKPKLCQNIYT